MYKKIYLIIVLFLQTILLNAQVKTDFNNTEKINENGKFNLPYQVKNEEILAPDLTSAYAKEKEELSKVSKIFFFAKAVSVKIDIPSKINWIEKGEYSYGRYTLKSMGAKTLSINFNNFFLPKGTEMYIYSSNGEMITGIITDNENNKNKVWGSSIYKGDEVNIEIKVPTKNKESLSLLLSNVAYGYKNIFVDKVSGFGQAGPCNINVLCPQGNAWAAERNSVVHLLLLNGTGFGSGSILMNTCSTNIPYILTANHVFTKDLNTSEWRIFFQAWSATCTPNQNSSGLMFNGATLKANWAASDFCLVQLNQTPAATPLILASSMINYAGWSRSTIAATGGVGIHHPKGDVMKISTFSNVFRSDNTTWIIGGQTFIPPGTLHWRVSWPVDLNNNPTSGVTEGGSSGSPLFDQNKRIVGQLAGGPSDCSNTSIKQDAYGRFDDSWTGGGTPATRLSDWLDPSGTSSMNTNTTRIDNLNRFNSRLSIIGQSVVCLTSDDYTIPNLPTGSTVVWSSSNTNVAVVNSPNAAQTTITKVVNGSITLSALVTNCQGQVTLTKSVIIGQAMPNGNFEYTTGQITNTLYPSFNNPISTGITTGGASIAGTTNLLWEKISPASGRQVRFTTSNSGAYAGFTLDNTDGPNTFINLRLTGSNVCGSFQGNFYFVPANCPLCPRMANSVSTENDYNNFNAIPNPAKSYTRVTIPEIFRTGATFELSSTGGVIQKRGILQSNQAILELDLNNLRAGAYFLTLKNKNNYSRIRIIKN